MTVPQKSIENLNMSWPPPMNNKESPFYDKTNNTHDVRPMARIHLKLIRGYEQNCQQSNIIGNVLFNQMNNSVL